MKQPQKLLPLTSKIRPYLFGVYSCFGGLLRGSRLLSYWSLLHASDPPVDAYKYISPPELIRCAEVHSDQTRTTVLGIGLANCLCLSTHKPAIV